MTHPRALQDMLSRATTRALHAARALSAPAQKKKLLGPKKNAKQVRDLLRTRLALSEAELEEVEAFLSAIDAHDDVQIVYGGLEN